MVVHEFRRYGLIVIVFGDVEDCDGVVVEFETGMGEFLVVVRGGEFDFEEVDGVFVEPEHFVDGVALVVEEVVDEFVVEGEGDAGEEQAG